MASRAYTTLFPVDPQGFGDFRHGGLFRSFVRQRAPNLQGFVGDVTQKDRLTRIGLLSLR